MVGVPSFVLVGLVCGGVVYYLRSRSSRQPLTVSMFGQPVTSTDAILVSSSKKVRSTTMGIIVRVLVCLQ